MDEEVIDDLYNRAVSKGYKKNRQQFVSLLHSDGEVMNDMYSYVQSKGYGKGVDDFKSLVGATKPIVESPATEQPKKKRSSVSPFADGGSELTKFDPRSGQVVQDTPKFATAKPEVKVPAQKLPELSQFGFQLGKGLPAQKTAPLPKFIEDQLQSITPDITGKTEETVVPQLEYQFGPLGFKFEEIDAGDFMKATSPSGESIRISLDITNSDAQKAETNKLNAFLRKGASTLTNLSTLQKQYTDANKKITSQKELDESLSRINAEEANVMARNADFIKLQNSLESERAKLESVPPQQRSNPEYIARVKDFISRADQFTNEFQTFANDADDLAKRGQQLNKSIGKYTEMKAQQGTWFGAGINAFANKSFYEMAKGQAGVAIDFIGEVISATGLPIMSPENYEKNFIEQAKKEGINVTEGQDFISLASKLDAETLAKIENRVNDAGKKAVKGEIIGDLDKASKMAMESSGVSADYYRSVEETFVGGALLGALTSIPAMAGGAVTRTILMGSQILSGLDAEMANDPDFADISENEKYLVKGPIAVAVAALESAGLSNLLNKKGFLNGLVLKALGKVGKGASYKTFGEVIKNEIDSAVGRGALTLGAGFLAEAETGALQEVADIGFKEIYNKAKEKEFFDTPDTVIKFIEQVGKAGLQEGIGAGVLSVPGSVSAAYTGKGFLGMDDAQFAMFEKMANDSNIQKGFVARLKYRINSGEITLAQGKDILNNYRNSVGLFNSLPENLDMKGKKEAMNLLKEKRDLERQIDGKDQALTVPQRNRVNEINQQLTKLSENAIQKQAAGQVPVQPGAGVSQEVQEGLTQAEPQVVTEAIVQQEVTPAQEEIFTLEDEPAPATQPQVQEQIAEEDIALSGLNDGFQAVTRNSFDVRSDADVMQKVGSKKSFVTSVTKKGKKYLVVGLRLNEDVGATTSGRDGYSFATIEDNGNLPSNAVDVLTQKAVANISSVYRNINNPTIDLFSPIEGIVEPQVVAQPVTETITPAPTVQPQVETLRAQEQAELTEALTDAEQYMVDGKIDGEKITDPAEKKIFDDIYNKYDKLITPLIKQEAIPASIQPEIDTIEAQRRQELEANKAGLDKPYYLGETDGPTLREFINQEYDAKIEELKAKAVPQEVDVESEVSLLEQLLAQEETAPTQVAGISMSSDVDVETLRNKTQSRSQQATTKEEKDSTTTRLKIIDTAKRAVKTLKSIFPDIDIVVHEDEGSYNAAMLEVDGVAGSKGNFFLETSPDGKTTGKININLSKADGRTVAHEVAHGILLKTFGDNKNLFNDFRTRLSKVLKGDVNQQLNDFANQYVDTATGELLDVNQEEFLAELTGMLAQQETDISVSTIQKVAALINEFVSKITGGKFKPFEDTKNTKDVVDFFNTISGAIREGGDIELNGGGEVGTFNFTSRSSLDIKEAPSVAGDSRSFIKDLVEDVDMIDFNGRKFVTNMYDYTTAGITDLGNGLTINMLGGKNYVPYMMSLQDKKIGDVSNLAAFNTKAQAESFARNSIKGNASLFAPHSGTLSQSWQFQQHTFAELVNLIVDKNVMSDAELIDVFNKTISSSKSNKKAFNAFKTKLGKDISNFDSFKNDPKKIVELLDIKNNYSPNLRKALNNAISADKTFQKAIGVKNKEEFFKRIMDPLNNGVQGGEIINVVEFDPKTFQIIQTKPGAIDHHPSFGWSILSKINGIYQPTKFYQSSSVTDSYVKYNKSGEQVSRKAEESNFEKKNVSSSAGSIPKVAEFNESSEAGTPTTKRISRSQINDALSKASGTTQVATTKGSYKKAANILKNIGVDGDVLDYGAGLGLGTDAMSEVLDKPVDSLEINPERWKGIRPVKYTDANQIDKKYDGIVSLNVVNVVPKEVRDFIVLDIFNNLKEGGTAVISSRGFKGDIDGAKNFVDGGEGKSYIIKKREKGKFIDVFQKGYDGNELVEYVQELLGDSALVLSNNTFGKRGVVITKLSNVKSRSQLPGNDAQRIVNLGRANGLSEQAISTVLQKRGFTQEAIDTALGKAEPAAKKVEVTEEFAPGYNRVLNNIFGKDGIIAKSRERNRPEEGTMQNVINYLQKTMVYVNATDVQREAMVRNVRKEFKKREKAAPSAEKVVGKPKKKQVTVDEMAALKDQIRLEARAAREAKGDLNTKRKMIADALKKAATEGNIGVKKVEAMLKRLTSLNVDSPTVVNKFIDYAFKVFQDAEYASRLSKAKGLKSNINKISKNKDKFANLRDLGSKFIAIDPSMLTSTELVEYNEIADKIYKSIQGSTLKGKGKPVAPNEIVDKIYNSIQGATGSTLKGKINLVDMVVESDANAYIDGVVEKQQKKILEDSIAEMSELLGIELTQEEYLKIMASQNVEEVLDKKYKEEDIKAAIEKSFNLYSAMIDQSITSGKDPFTGEDVQYSDIQKKTIQEFIKMDINLLSPRSALEAVDALINFINNGSIAKMTSVLSKYNGKKNMIDALNDGVKSRPIKKYFSKGLGKVLLEQTANINLVFERVFGGFTRGQKMEEAMGIADLVNGKAKGQKDADVIVEEYIAKYFKTKPNKQEFNTAENNTERGMGAFMSRNINGTDAQITTEFNRRKKLVKESIAELEKGNEQEVQKAKIYQEVYDNILSDSNTVEDVQSKMDKTNLEAIEFWQNKWREKYQDLSDVALGVYNKILDKDTNFTTDRYSKLSSGTEDSSNLLNEDMAFLVNTGNAGLYKKETGVLMAATRPKKLPTDEKSGEANRYIDLSFDSNNSNAMYDALVDINTAGAIRQIDAAMNSAAFRKIMANQDDANLVRSRINLYVNNIRNKNPFSNNELKNFVKKLNRISAIGVGQSLGGITQPIKQTVPIIVNTVINAGTLDVGSIFDKSKQDFINRSGRAIANRGIESRAQVSTLNKMVDEIAKSRGEKLFRNIEMANQWILKNFLVKWDVGIARASWMTYYQQSLKSQGINPSSIDYNTHEVNEKAANYAQRQVDRQQNASDSDMAGALLSSKEPVTQVITKMLMPFSSFRMNQSARLGSDMAVLMSLSSDMNDRKIAARSVAGFAFEMVTFRALSAGIGIMIYDFVKSYIVDDEDEEDREKKIDSIVKGQLTSTVADMFSPIPIADPVVQGGVSTLLESYQDMLDVEEEDRISIYGDSKKDMIQSLGTFGIAAGRALQLYEMGQLASGKGFKDSFNRTKYIRQDYRDGLKNLFIPAVMSNIGLAPSEVNSIVRTTMSEAKKKSSTNESGEKSKSSGGGKISVGSINKTDLKKNDRETYDEMYGENSPGYKMRKEQKDLKKKMKEEFGIKD